MPHLLNAAQDKNPFCIFYIINKILQNLELIDEFIVGNYCPNF